MGLLPRRVSVPDQETTPVKVPYRNLAAIASHEDGAQLNFYYEFRSDTQGESIYAKKREGISILSSLASASTQVGRGIYSWRKSNASTDTLFYALDDATDTKLYTDSGGTGSTAKTLTGITGKQIRFVPVTAFDGSTTTEKLFIFSGFSDVEKYDGSAYATSSAGTPLSGASNRGMYGAMYRNMLVVARTANNPNRVWFSNVGAPETFGSSNALDFPSEITGLHVYENALLVFTRNSIYTIVGSSPTEIVVSGSTRGLSQKGIPAGTDSHESIARVGDWVYFWNRDRVFRYDLSTIQEVAYPKLLKTLGSVIKTVSSQFAGHSFNGRYYLAITYSSGTTNNAVLVYDPRVGAAGTPIDEWVLHTSPWVNSFTTYRSSADAVPVLLFVTNSNTSRKEKVYTYNGSTVPLDNTSASTTSTVTFQYTSQFLDHGDGHMIKKTRYVFFRTKGIGVTATATLQVGVDFGGYTNVLTFAMDAGGFVLDSSLLDTDALTDGTYSTTSAKRVSLPDARTISVRLYDTQQAGQTEFYDFDIQLIPKKLKTR